MIQCNEWFLRDYAREATFSFEIKLLQQNKGMKVSCAFYYLGNVKKKLEQNQIILALANQIKIYDFLSEQK